MSAKRSDLQGIRGLAIISVLLFHFFPDFFPNGYIGVDQFFVLSGFLIAMILDREKALNMETMTSFYYRRLKRIVPLYLIVVLFVILSLFVVFPSSNLELNIQSAWPSLFFIKNIIQGNTMDMNYAKMLSLAEDVFTHTWSLGVEMQFYLVVPILMLPTKCTSQTFCISFLGTTAWLSLTYFTFTDESTAFNSMFARIWQFIIGILSHLLTRSSINSTSEQEEPCLKENDGVGKETIVIMRPNNWINSVIVNLLTLLLIMLTSCPYAVDSFTLRVLVTTVTGLIIICGIDISSSVLTNRILVYTGDISYSLYLVHWPIYAYIKLSICSKNMFIALIIGILISVILGMLLTETFEKYYLKLGRRPILKLIFGLYAANFVVLYNQGKIHHVLSSTSRITDYSMNNSKIDNDLFNRENFTVDEMVDLNFRYYMEDGKNLFCPACSYNYTAGGPYGWCNFKNVSNASDGVSILLIGNSYAANIAKPFYRFCARKASSVKMYVERVCELLTETKVRGFNCEVFFDTHLEIVQIEKPDVLVIITRYIDTMFTPIMSNGSIHLDPVYIMARKRLKLYEESVGNKIFIMQALPEPSQQITQILNEALRKGQRIDNFYLERKVGVTPARRRIDALVKDCPKCQIVDYMDIFKVNDQFTFYNNKTGESYFSSGQHMTPLGVHMVTPLYQKLCDQL